MRGNGVESGIVAATPAGGVETGSPPMVTTTGGISGSTECVTSFVPVESRNEQALLSARSAAISTVSPRGPRRVVLLQSAVAASRMTMVSRFILPRDPILASDPFHKHQRILAAWQDNSATLRMLRESRGGSRREEACVLAWRLPDTEMLHYNRPIGR